MAATAVAPPAQEASEPTSVERRESVTSQISEQPSVASGRESPLIACDLVTSETPSPEVNVDKMVESGPYSGAVMDTPPAESASPLEDQQVLQADEPEFAVPQLVRTPWDTEEVAMVPSHDADCSVPVAVVEAPSVPKENGAVPDGGTALSTGLYSPGPYSKVPHEVFDYGASPTSFSSNYGSGDADVSPYSGQYDHSFARAATAPSETTPEATPAEVHSSPSNSSFASSWGRNGFVTPPPVITRGLKSAQKSPELATGPGEHTPHSGPSQFPVSRYRFFHGEGRAAAAGNMRGTSPPRPAARPGLPARGYVPPRETREPSDVGRTRMMRTSSLQGSGGGVAKPGTSGKGSEARLHKRGSPLKRGSPVKRASGRGAIGGLNSPRDQASAPEVNPKPVSPVRQLQFESSPNAAHTAPVPPRVVVAESVHKGDVPRDSWATKPVSPLPADHGHLNGRMDVVPPLHGEMLTGEAMQSCLSGIDEPGSNYLRRWGHGHSRTQSAENHVMSFGDYQAVVDDANDEDDDGEEVTFF